MRVLFLVPGSVEAQLHCLPAAAQVAEGLGAQIQVACAPAAASAWSLLPAVEKLIPFDFNGNPTLADWANLLGNVREPDFQACINLASGRQVDLMLSMSHIPTRVAAGGFSATSTVTAGSGWPAQTMAAYLSPLGLSLDANSFRLALPKPALEQAATQLPAGQGPALLLAPAGGASDWPSQRWQELPDQVRAKLPDLRVVQAKGSGKLLERAAQVASCDVVLSSDPITTELALLAGMPLVALGRDAASLPNRQGVQAVGQAGQLDQLHSAAVLTALGLG
ncbi:lipopolysaccharide heptosyltransferase family protein [Synechococcus sp. HK05]|uniref:glycosyltransferase family 9 protein n=1 Tax=Synechococcus sp. HK05 TaxID=2725975 RepID=UPI001C381DCF|nr:lipopolysaccharide heptosyltransferase family protein [Synechococcus sp. HK05]MBV2351611.1 lipopolysaccharide heptosyltransferase family protein [Synechococcus sp. HK05]